MFGVDALVRAGVRNTGVSCSYRSGTACHFECDPGYRMIGLPGLLCGWDGTWSGQLPRCVRDSDTDCGTLEEIDQQDPNGETTYVNNLPVSNLVRHRDQKPDPESQSHRFIIHRVFGSDLDPRRSRTGQGAVLQVYCPKGWKLLGDAERTCQKDGVWSSTPARCVDASCPSLPLTQGLRVHPPSCTEARQSPGTVCRLTCDSGYALVGAANITCGQNRRWTPNLDTVDSAISKITGVCLDIEPPKLTCRPNMTVSVRMDGPAMLSWDAVAPTVSDNSRHVTVTSPDVPGSPFPVYFGKQIIRFVAQDKNHRVRCALGIEVKDPRVRAVKCPSQEVSVFTRHELGRLVLPEVRFEIMDSGQSQPVGHLCSPVNHTMERTGRHQVVCWAYAPWGPLGAECRFTVNMQHEICPLPPPPLHGNVSCSATNSSRLECSVTCQPGYQFHELPEQPYICGLNGRWQHRTLWPDCSSSYSRIGAMIDASYSLSLTFPNASICLARKLSVQNQVLPMVQSVLDSKCDRPRECSIVKLNVTCFGRDGQNIDGLDDVYDIYEPLLNITIKANSTIHNMQENVDLLESISSDLMPVLENITQIDQQSSHQDRIYGVDCRLGYQALADILCVACPAGTYWNRRLVRCMKCSLGRYQTAEGQTACITCPNDTFTDASGAKSLSQCAAGCPPGHWSPTGLAPCQPCQIGQYQPRPRALVCLNCPTDQTTEAPGAVHLDQCYEECPRGSAGYAGRQPYCEPCPMDTYEPLRGQEQCKPLGHMLVPGNYLCNQTTFMCYNGGQCQSPVDLDMGVSCRCQPGFIGYNCEQLDPTFCPKPFSCPTGPLTGEQPFQFWQYADPCESSPCHNGGFCLNSNHADSFECYCPLGYVGPLCSDAVALCRGLPCLHGECHGGSCRCAQGYAGVSCNESVDPCWFGLNYEGCRPDDPTNACLSQPCAFGSTCLLRNGGRYVCKCQTGKTGTHCSKELSLDVDMEFGLEPRLGWDVTLPSEFMPPLTSMTVGMWLRPSPTTSYYTVVSLDTSRGTTGDFVNRELSQRVFSLDKTDKLRIEFFNESIETGTNVPTRVWTHLCFSWTQTSGAWQVYLNGTLARSGRNLAQNQSIPDHTFVTLAPRNTTLSDWTIFRGRISQFNIFSDVLSSSQVQNLANTSACDRTFHGDVIGWTNALPYAFATKSSLCLDVNECWFPSQFHCVPPSDVCVDTLGSYKCTDPENSSQNQTTLWLERIGIGAAVCLAVAVCVGIVVSACRRGRRSRQTDVLSSGVQLRQGVSPQRHGNRGTGDVLRKNSTGTDGENRNPIVRSAGRRLGGRSIFKRRHQKGYMQGRLIEADSLEETVIFDQSSNSGDTDANSFKPEKPSQTGEFHGQSDSVQGARIQELTGNTDDSSSHTGEELDPAQPQFDTSDSLPDEPASLTFRTTAPQGISNPLEFLRLKMPSLGFTKKQRERPIGYTHLREVTGASNQHAWDAGTNKDAGTNAAEDPNLSFPQDGGHEIHTDIDMRNNDNVPGCNRPSSN
ncbi:hypothetical protein EGW08_004329 [Elysia chlorotica]|uniref:Sushi, von Willebrand factor type A, EGF and pentraxin domain-containing protein 1 n=1 Tax=Elysia chlorotica TaxID=188477 RepID=A0A3S1ABY1_ELYCH|nr:hypothetical protein EGW08_004329 [Elysia chlorotica]